MTTMTDIQDRVVLLSQAIDLCQSLAVVLRMLGPKPSSDIFQCDPPVPSLRQQQIRSKEATLEEAFRAAIETRNQVLAPVSRVMDDVLRLFFQPGDASATSYDLVSSAFTLSAVCRRWRHVALETASLWSHLSLHVPQISLRGTSNKRHPRCKDTYKRADRRGELSLVRSRDTLLTLDIWTSYWTDYMPTFMQRVSSYAQRVQDLTIRVDNVQGDAADIHEYCRFIQSMAPTLRRLSLQKLPQRRTDDSEQALHALFSTPFPSLQEADMQKLTFTDPPQFTFLASCRVLKLDCAMFHNFSRASCEVLFRTCAELEELRLNLYSYDESVDFGPRARVSLPRVHSLTVTYLMCKAVAFPFPMVHLPNLRHLEVSCDILGQRSAFSDTLPRAVRNAIQATSSLETISVRNILPEHVCELILPHLSSVRKFVLHYYLGFHAHDSSPYMMHVISHLLLVRRADGSFLLPNLKELYLDVDASMGNLRMLREFLKARRAANLPIHALRLELRSFPRLDSDGQDDPLSRLDEVLGLEGSVAALLESFSIMDGNWQFNKEIGGWEKRRGPSLLWE